MTGEDLDRGLERRGLAEHAPRLGREREEFSLRFGVRPEVVSTTPGRVCLLGEHVDYHGGVVITAAINNRTSVLLRPRRDGVIRVENASAHFQPATARAVVVAKTVSGASRWYDYVLAVYHLVSRRAPGKLAGGCDLMVGGDMVVSAGLSSSAALQVGVAEALAVAFGLRLSSVEVSLLCQAAEALCNQDSGVMDQMAVCRDVEGGEASVIDCARPAIVDTLAVPEDVAFVAVPSKVRAEKAASEYNVRVAAGLYALRRLLEALGERGARHIEGAAEPTAACIEEIASGETLRGMLRRGCSLAAIHAQAVAGTLPLGVEQLLALLPEDVSWAELRAAGVEIGGAYWRREENRRALETRRLAVRAPTRHVFSEMRRTSEFLAALRSRDSVRAGRLMNETHQSLSGDYAAGWPMGELLVASARRLGALGARQVGAGFGGSILALVEAPRAGELASEIAAAYARETGIETEPIVITPSPGTRAFALGSRA